jgi:hypothetical protein
VSISAVAYTAGGSRAKKETSMGVLITVGVRLLLLYLVIRLVWSLFSGKKNTIPHGQSKGAHQEKRFDTHGKDVVDGDYEELR